MDLQYNVANVKLGVCEIEFNGEHVGHTMGGATLRIGTLAAEKKVDRYGDMVIGYHDMGTTVEVVCRIAEETIDNIAKYFPNATKSGDTVTFGKTVGDELQGYGLVLDPTDGGDPVVIYKAVPNPGETVEVTYSIGDQRVWEVTFKGVPDDNRPDGDTLFRIGGTASYSSTSSSSSASSSSSESSSSSSS
jgi:hypothetical protein